MKNTDPDIEAASEDITKGLKTHRGCSGSSGLREIVARLLVPYYFGGFENQDRHEPDDTGFRKWKNPPGTPNARAYELTDQILAAVDAIGIAKSSPDPVQDTYLVGGPPDLKAMSPINPWRMK